MRVFVTCLGVGFAVLAAAQQPPEPKCLVSNGQGYAFGNPRQIGTGLVGTIEVAKDGKAIAYQRILAMDPLDEIRGKVSRPKMVLSIWNATNDSTWNVAEMTVERPVRFEFKWSATPGIGTLVTLRPYQNGQKQMEEAVIEKIVAQGNQRQNLARYVLEAEGAMVDPSPDGKWVLVRGIEGAGADEVVDTANGRRISVGHENKDSYRMWGADGSLMSARPNSDGRRAWFKYDFSAGTYVAAEPHFGEDGPQPFAVHSSMLSEKQGGSAVLVATPTDALGFVAATTSGQAQPAKPPLTKAEKLALSDPTLMGPVVIDADPSVYEICKEGKLVVYGKRGGLYICPFELVDIDALEKSMAARAKTKAMNKAKQVALAMIIYGADYDDILPLNSGWQDSVYPYMKDRDMANGFLYSLNGNNMTKFDNPANTMLGSVDTPYGRAIAYADGHVKWQPGINPESLFLSVVGEDRRRLRFVDSQS